MFPTQKCKISARSLRSLDIIYGVFSNLSSSSQFNEQDHNHECYEYKNIITVPTRGGKKKNERKKKEKGEKIKKEKGYGFLRAR